MPELLAARGPNERLQIWSAACSRAEPYTIAMLLEDAMPNASARVTITATDLSGDGRADEGRPVQPARGQPRAAGADARPALHAGGQRVGGRRAVRRMVTACECNLAAPLPRMGPFDVVYLRNVLIYFDLPTKQAIVRRVREAHASRRLAVPRCGRDDARGGRLQGAGRRRPQLCLPPAEGGVTCVLW